MRLIVDGMLCIVLRGVALAQLLPPLPLLPLLPLLRGDFLGLWTVELVLPSPLSKNFFSASPGWGPEGMSLVPAFFIRFVGASETTFASQGLLESTLLAAVEPEPRLKNGFGDTGLRAVSRGDFCD